MILGGLNKGVLSMKGSKKIWILLIIILLVIMYGYKMQLIVSLNENEIKILESEISDLKTENSQYIKEKEILKNKNAEILETNTDLLLEIDQITKKKEKELKDLMVNPIDQFFSNHPFEASGKDLRIEYSTLYSESWKAEMNYAFSLLIKNSNSRYVNDISRLKELFVEVAELDSEIHVLSFISNAFNGTPDNENLSYGSDYYFFMYEILASRYKSYTEKVHNYLEFSEVDYNYNFDPESIIEKMDVFKK